jgi:hypothetical protein
MPRGDHNRKPLHERAWNGRTAAAYGCTITFESDDGMTLTLARVGAPNAATRALCAEAEAIDPTFRVVAYSSPRTILTDLEGRYTDGSRALRHVAGLSPEGQALSGAGLLRMLHPRLRSTHPSASRKYAASDRYDAD